MSTMNNTVNMATATMNETGKSLNIGRREIGAIMSIISFVALVAAIKFGNNSNVFDVCGIISILTGIPSYIVGGLHGFKSALEKVKKIAFLGWVAIPFPYDLGTVCATFGAALMLFLLCPVFFVVPAYIRDRKAIGQ